MKEFNKDGLAKRLVFLRERKGWTKRDVVNQDAISTKNLSTYANWEYGIREPDLKTLTELANLYGVSTDFLLGLTDKELIDREKLTASFSNKEQLNWYLAIGENGTESELNKLYNMWKIIKDG